MRANNKTELVVWLYKKFLNKTLDKEKDKVLIKNLVTFLEALEEIAEKEQKLTDMFS